MAIEDRLVAIVRAPQAGTDEHLAFDDAAPSSTRAALSDPRSRAPAAASAARRDAPILSGGYGSSSETSSMGGRLDITRVRISSRAIDPASHASLGVR